MIFSVRSVVKRVLPAGVLNRIKSVTVGAADYSHAFRRARAARLKFHSGLGDFSTILYALVRSMKPAVVVEIGSARGKSTCAIASGLRENGHGKLYAIDPHLTTDWNDISSVDTLTILRRNIATLGLTKQVEIIRSSSEDAARDWSRSIDLIFIDGDHSYEGVKRDWEMFVKHVAKFGIVVFHDTIWDITPPDEWSWSDMGVPRFVDELRQHGYQIVTIARDFGTAWCSPQLVAFRCVGFTQVRSGSCDPRSRRSRQILRITAVPDLSGMGTIFPVCRKKTR